MQDTLNPQDLAQKAADDVIRNTQPDEAENVIGALQKHYDVLNKTQEIHIEFLSEFIKNLKNLQQRDKESLDNLKKQVLSHVLNNN